MPTAARTSDVIDLALAEDVGTGDVTTEATVPAGARRFADVVVREPGVVCGLDAAIVVFRRLDPDAEMDVRLPTAPPSPMRRPPSPRCAAATAPCSPASAPRSTCCSGCRGSPPPPASTWTQSPAPAPTILDTRKTAPGPARARQARRACGGGRNHRAGPGRRDADQGQPRRRRRRGRRRRCGRCARAGPDLPVEVEVDTLEQLDEALAARRRDDPARQHDAARPARGGAPHRRPSPARGLGRHHPGHRRARSPRPASTRSPSAR